MQTFLPIVASNALLVVVLAAGVTLLGRVWKNPLCLHLLWLFVLLKLVTPPLVTVPVPLPERQASPAIEESAASRPLAAPSRVEIAGRAAAPATVDVNDAIAVHSHENRVTAESQAPPASVDAVPANIEGQGMTWLTLLGWVWGVGIVVCASGRVYRILSFRRLLRSGEAASPEVLGMAAGIAKRLGLRRIPEIRMMPVCMSPLVWSLGGRPRVILPAALFERLDGAAREAILAHELAHVRRKDHWVRLLEMLVTTLFWWHPVVWWAARQLQELEDQCCDAMVLGSTPQAAKSYATALLDTLDFLSDRSIAAPLGATAAKSSTSLARRIAMLKNSTPAMRLTVGRAILLAAVVAVPMVLAFGAKPPEATDKVPPTTLESASATTPAPAKAVVQSSLAAQPAQSLKQALAAFNEKSAQDAIGRSQPPLTEREVITAIREWNRKKIEVGDQTYAIFEKIADTKTLPQGSALEFTTRHVHDGRDVTVWWIDLSVMTGKTTGYTFRIRAGRSTIGQTNPWNVNVSISW